MATSNLECTWTATTSLITCWARVTRGARTDFAYFNDDGVLVAYRHENWKAVFCEMKKPRGFAVWYEPFTCRRIPKLFNLRMDPFERADIVSDQYDDWRIQNAYLHPWLITKAAAFLETFVEYPPSQPRRVSRSIRSRRMSSARSKSGPGSRAPSRRLRAPNGRPRQLAAAAPPIDQA